MNSRLKLFLFAAIILIASVATYLAIFKQTNNKGDGHIKVAQFGDILIYAPLYIADMKGYFKEEGLSIDLINTGGDDKTFAAVLGGSADFGVADPTFVAIASEKGLNGKVIGGIVNGVPFWAITKNMAVPKIEKPTQLAPYRVGTLPSPSTIYTIQSEMFKEAGLPVNIQQGTLGALMASLNSGSADIILELEPNVSKAIAEGAQVVYSFKDKYPQFAFTGITTTSKMIKEQPEKVQKFMNAITKASNFILTNPIEASNILSERYPNIPQAVIEDAITRMISDKTLLRDAVISEEAWESATKLRHRMGDLKSIENVRDILDMSFAIEAAK